MQIDKKLELLSKTCWRLCDIENYFGVNKALAFKYKKRAIEDFNGSVPYGKSYVKVDSVLALFATNRETEIKALKD